jgi:hypothetical protein
MIKHDFTFAFASVSATCICLVHQAAESGCCQRGADLDPSLPGHAPAFEKAMPIAFAKLTGQCSDYSRTCMDPARLLPTTYCRP